MIRQVDEYDWIYSSTANGGSGPCENNPSSTCIATLGGTLCVTSSTTGKKLVPVTVPQKVAFGTSYAGERSATSASAPARPSPSSRSLPDRARRPRTTKEASRSCTSR